MLDNQLDSIKKNFINYLASLGLSPKSTKNYKSDLAHFTGWLILKIRSFGSHTTTLTESIPFLKRGLAEEYKNYMAENSIPAKTINRRLSTLRHLSRHLLAAFILDFDFMEGIENISEAKPFKHKHESIMSAYRSFLEAEKVSSSTVKNYVSDVRQFLIWLESNKTIISENH